MHLKGQPSFPDLGVDLIVTNRGAGKTYLAIKNVRQIEQQTLLGVGSIRAHSAPRPWLSASGSIKVRELGNLHVISLDDNAIRDRINRAPQLRERERRSETEVISPPYQRPADYGLSQIFRRGLVLVVTLLTASAAILPFVPSLAIFGIAGTFLTMGGTILADSAVSKRPVQDPRLGTLFVLAGLGTAVVAIIGLAT
jgi:hypothetical protein